MSCASTGNLNVVVLPENEVNLLSKQQWFREGKNIFQGIMLACYYPKIVQFCPRKKCSKYLISNFNIAAFLKHFSSTSENIMMKNSIKTTKSILLSKKYLETIWNIDKRYKLRFLIDQFRNILWKEVSNKG